jgi:hypothetical protein
MSKALTLPVRLLSMPASSEVGFDLELPTELEEALDGGSLRRCFYRLSSLQKDCYVEWVGTDPTEAGRRVRADLVCAVIRRLAA